MILLSAVLVLHLFCLLCLSVSTGTVHSRLGFTDSILSLLGSIDILFIYSSSMQKVADRFLVYTDNVKII